ncbi:MAG: CBS domain-containing protein [Aquincola sp.]|nr:CBS domain-containing protein [Aquincola sp.]MDH4287949.1 CBS domain-containing protein [Aquincola sp.]MDH5328952.1 CBS domain-containing protein [Aquincola sp.]
MNVGSICKRHIVTIDASDSLQQAASLMREHHVGALVVIETSADGQRVAGVVTDRDLAIEVLARGGDAARVPVGRVSQGRLVGMPEDADIAEAVQSMQAAGVRRLLVHDADGHLVGLVSFDDLLPACVMPLAGLAEVLRKGLEREVAERGAIAAASRPALRVPAMGTAGWPNG